MTAYAGALRLLGALPPSGPVAAEVMRAVTGWRAVPAGLVALVVLLVSRGAGGRGGAHATGERVLVLSLPGLSWDEVYQGDTPNLDELLDESAVAAMSVRDVLRRTRPPGTATRR